jgi:hypothetical protein
MIRPPKRDHSREEDFPSLQVVLLASLAMVLIIILGVLTKRHGAPVPPGSVTESAVASNVARKSEGERTSKNSFGRHSAEPQGSAEEIVAAKIIKFSKIRRKDVHALAKNRNVPVPADVERFFEAVENGRWDEIDAAHEALLLTKDQLNQPRSADLHQIWRPIQETWGAAREAHDWPAQRLLDYGNAILGSLRPGMIFAGGTDPGCFIPTMLNETGDGERHVVLTQNALADGTYLNYLDFQYGEQITTLTQDDSQQAFQAYIADAQKRLEHDQQFPNEPPQLKPGEDVKVIDGKVQVSGQVAVMAINEKLFQMLMAENPTTPFAMEESFPFSSLYGNATPLGPIIEMGFPDESNPLTADRAAQSVDYWRTAADQLLSDPATPDGSDPRKAYSKLVSSQAGILADHQFTDEAEQAFRIASQLYPASPEVTFRYVNLLTSQNRLADALQVAENALKADPANQQFLDLRNRLSASKARP